MNPLLPAAIALGLVFTASPAEAATGIYKNCTAYNAKYKNGVGKTGAKDKISGKYVPGKSVTTFKVSTKLYQAALAKNSRLDGDKDGVACEKK